MNSLLQKFNRIPNWVERRYPIVREADCARLVATLQRPGRSRKGWILIIPYLLGVGLIVFMAIKFRGNHFLGEVVPWTITVLLGLIGVAIEVLDLPGSVPFSNNIRNTFPVPQPHRRHLFRDLSLTGVNAREVVATTLGASLQETTSVLNCFGVAAIVVTASFFAWYGHAFSLDAGIVVSTIVLSTVALQPVGLLYVGWYSANSGGAVFCSWCESLARGHTMAGKTKSVSKELMKLSLVLGGMFYGIYGVYRLGWLYMEIGDKASRGRYPHSWDWFVDHTTAWLAASVAALLILPPLLFSLFRILFFRKPFTLRMAIASFDAAMASVEDGDADDAFRWALWFHDPGRDPRAQAPELQKGWTMIEAARRLLSRGEQ